MTLPSSRNRTYAPGSQIFSADLNDIQDAIIDLKTGQRWKDFPVQGGDYLNGVYAGAGTPQIKYVTSGGTNFYSFLIYGLTHGAKIWRCRARIQDSATGPTTLKCRGRTTAGGAGAVVGDVGAVASLGNGTVQTIQSAQDSGGANPLITMVGGVTFAVEVFLAGGSAACNIFSVGVLLSEDV